MFISRCFLWVALSTAVVAQFPEQAPLLTTNYMAAPNGPFPKGQYLAFRCLPHTNTLLSYAISNLKCLISDGGQISGTFSVDPTTQECLVSLGTPATFSFEKDWLCCIADITNGTTVQISPCTKFKLALIYSIIPITPHATYMDAEIRDQTTNQIVPAQPKLDGNFRLKFCNPAGCAQGNTVRLNVIYDIPTPPMAEVLPNTTIMAGSDNFFFRFHFQANFSANPYAFVNLVLITPPNSYLPALTFITSGNGTLYADVASRVGATNQKLKASIFTEGTWQGRLCNPTGCSSFSPFQMLVRYDGGWSSWTYDSCKGIDVRSCTYPTPRHGGADCQEQWYRPSGTPRYRVCHVEDGKRLESPDSHLTISTSTKEVDSRMSVNTRFLCAKKCTESPNCLRYAWNKPANCVLTLGII